MYIPRLPVLVTLPQNHSTGSICSISSSLSVPPFKMRKLGHPCRCITEGSLRLEYRPSVPYSHRALSGYAHTVRSNRPRGVHREGRVTSTFTSPGNPQSSYREPMHTLRIHLDPNLRLLQERGLLRAPSPRDTGELPRCTRPIFSVSGLRFWRHSSSLLWLAHTCPPFVLYCRSSKLSSSM